MNDAEFALPHEDVWTRHGGAANEAEINEFLEECPNGLPITYIKLLRNVNGGECELGFWPWWLELWPIAKVLSTNAEPMTEHLREGFFAIGKGDEGVVFAFKVNEPGR